MGGIVVARLVMMESMVADRRLVEPGVFALLRASREFLAENFDRKVRLADSAELAYMSEFHYQRMFKRAFGESPHEFVSRMRIEAAQTMLAKRDLTVSEICLEVGYESLGTFSARFSREVGCSPTEFRRVFAMPEVWSLKQIPGCFRHMHALRA